MWIVRLALRRPYTFVVMSEEMAEVVTIRRERSFTTSVNDIEHRESQSLPGLSIVKTFFHPNAKVEAAVAQLAAASQSVLHSLPAGMTAIPKRWRRC